MVDTKTTDLINATLNKLTTNLHVASWTDLDTIIGQLGTISDIKANDADAMRTVMFILGILAANPLHISASIKSFARVLDSIMEKNSNHAATCVGIIENLVKFTRNDQYSLAALYQALGHNIMRMSPAVREQALNVLYNAASHPGASHASLRAATAAANSLSIIRGQNGYNR